jgi:ribokinase
LTFPGLQIKAVDTTGAGDVFHGAFIYGLLQNWSLERIMKFGNAAAGLSCRRIGARAGIRPLSEILQHTSSL